MPPMTDGFVRASDVLREAVAPAQVRRQEKAHGNRDFWEALDILEVAGPFTPVTPWELQDERGERRINASGYSATPFGDVPPALASFIAELMGSRGAMWLPQQATSPWRAALSANLVRLLARELPSHSDSRVFFSNSGTEAIEGALKMAKATRPKARHIISFSAAYHGKTYGALSITPNAEYQDIFRPLLPGAVTVPFGDLEALERKIGGLGPDKVIAVVVEPIQGEGGVNIPPPGYLRGLGATCARHGITVIADEIQTGLGRTGHWFESAAQGLDPDIITLAKPLGGGGVPVGATIARDKVYRKMLGGLASKRHSNTFGGNTMAMAVGLKSLELLIEGDLPARSLRLGQVGLGRLQQLQARYPALIQAVRGQGMLMAVQFQPMLAPTSPDAFKEVVHEATALLALRLLHHAGVHLNVTLSQKRTLRLTPALDMPDEVFAELLNRVERFAARTPSAFRILTRTPPATLARLLQLALR